MDAGLTRQGQACNLRFRLGDRQGQRPPPALARRWHPLLLRLQLARFVDDRLTVIVLANSDQCNSGALAQGIARRIVPALTVKPPEPIADSNPKTTERLRTVLIGGQKGEVDPKLFTEAAQKTLVGAIKEVGKTSSGLSASSNRFDC